MSQLSDCKSNQKHPLLAPYTLGRHFLEAAEDYVIMTCAGVSVSGLQRSVVQVNPDSAEGAELRAWWDSEGIMAPTQHAGEGLASSRK